MPGSSGIGSVAVFFFMNPHVQALFLPSPRSARRDGLCTGCGFHKYYPDDQDRKEGDYGTSGKKLVTCPISEVFSAIFSDPVPAIVLVDDWQKKVVRDLPGELFTNSLDRPAGCLPDIRRWIEKESLQGAEGACHAQSAQDFDRPHSHRHVPVIETMDECRRDRTVLYHSER